MHEQTFFSLSSIAAQFCQFDRLLSAKPLGDGHINSTYLIDFEKNGKADCFVLQAINQEVFKIPRLVMDNLAKINNHLLLKADYPYEVIVPMRTLNNQAYFEHKEDGFWRALPYIKDSYAPENCSDAQIAYEAAKAYGGFTKALLDFPAATLSDTIPGFHDSDQRWEYFTKIMSNDPFGRVREIPSEISLMYKALPVFRQISALKQDGSLPLRVTHNDTKAGNVLFSTITHKALAVIDLDTVMPGTILSDFGDMVRTFCVVGKEDDLAPPQWRAEVFQALSEGFLSQTNDFLSPAEREHLFLGGLWIIAEQALRFLTDYIAGDVYYKTQYENQNLARAQNQLALYFACQHFLGKNREVLN